MIVTEYGAELEGKAVNQRGHALTEIAHPDFRDGLREAAIRASKGARPGLLSNPSSPFVRTW